MNKPLFFVDEDIRKAETLPASFYSSAEHFEQSKALIFEKSWQWMGDIKNTVPLTEHIYPAEFIENFIHEPILIVRDKNDNLHCLSNVCTHRGNILIHNPGKSKQLTCMYHGRKFELNGDFKTMPEFHDAIDFPRPCDSLPVFSIHNWKSHLFVGLNPEIQIRKCLGIIEERVGFLPLEHFTLDKSMSKDYLVNCHWALYCDNYLEGFHIPFVHNDLHQALDYGQYSTLLFDQMSLQIGYSNGSEEIFNLPTNHIDYGKNIAAYYFWIFPNMMFNFYPWGLSINIVKPCTINKTKVSFITYVYDQDKMNSGMAILLDKVEKEDEFVVEGVHRGLKSNYYKSGRFSPTREQGVHYFHQLLAHFMNKI